MFLMDERALRVLIKEAGRAYSRIGMSGLEGWVNSKNGNINYAKQIYEIISEKNSSPSTSLFSISSSLEEEIIMRILKNGKNN